MNQAFNMDCMTAMKEMPDNAFDLAVVDPPYGDGGDSFNGALRDRQGITHSACASRTGITRIGGSWSKKYGKKLLRGM